MRDRLSRRAWLCQTAGAAAAISLLGRQAPSKAADGKKADMPIIDTHQHLWDLERFRLPWLDGDAKLNRSFRMPDYLRATDGLNVVKTIYMEVDLDPAQQDEEAKFVIETCRRADTPMVAGVISGRPADYDGFRAYITKYKDSPYIKGVRQVLHGSQTPPGYCLQPSFIKSVQLLGELGMRYDLCIRPTDLGDAAKLVDACPDTRFILDHCGNPNVQHDLKAWRKALGEMARRKNVVCKVSGFIATAKPYAWSVDDLAPVVRHTLDVFGPDRVMFGGDWPVCTLTATYRQWAEALKSIVAQRSATERRKLFHDNAVRWYGLAQDG